MSISRNFAGIAGICSKATKLSGNFVIPGIFAVQRVGRQQAENDPPLPSDSARPINERMEVIAFGHNHVGQASVPALPEGCSYVAIAAGHEHTVALRSGELLADQLWKGCSQLYPRR